MSRFNTDFKSQAYKTIDEWTGVIEGALFVFDKEGLEKKAEKALDILEEITQRYVPVDTGALRDSWYRRVEVRNGEVELIFGYDENNSLDYAWFIYINPLGYTIHKDHQPQARDKWLEIALEEAMPAMLKVLSNP